MRSLGLQGPAHWSSRGHVPSEISSSLPLLRVPNLLLVNIPKSSVRDSDGGQGYLPFHLLVQRDFPWALEHVLIHSPVMYRVTSAPSHTPGTCCEGKWGQYP